MKRYDKSEFIHFEERASDHPLVDRVWRCHSDRADGFLSVAANSFEMAITQLGGKSFLTLRGPETVATVVDCPAEGQWVGIRFKPGTFMPRFLPGSLRDHKDVTLPRLRSFLLAKWFGSSTQALAMPRLRWAPCQIRHALARSDRGRHLGASSGRAILALRTTPLPAIHGRHVRYV